MASARRVARLAAVALSMLGFAIPVSPPVDAQEPPAQAASPAPGLPLPADPYLRPGAFDGAAPADRPTRLPEDGDMTPPAEVDRSLDGVFASPEPPPPTEDGLDPQSIDTREPAERDAFAFDANAGFLPPDDAPLLFQIEDLAPFDPAQNRRPRRFATLDPYNPVGLRLGTFVLFPETELSVAHTSNVFASANAEGDGIAEARPSLRLVSDWSNHALEAQVSGDLTSHRRFGSENDRAYRAELRGRLDVTRRTNLQASIGHASAQEERSAIDAANAGDRASVATDTFAASLNHRFNRLSVQLRGGVTDSTYSDVGTARDRDVQERRIALRGSWEFKPTLQVFTEVEVNDRDFEAASIADGRLRNSDGLRLRTGVSFGNSSDVLRGEASLGYARQDIADTALEDADGLILDGNLAWRLNGLTSFLFTASSDISSVTRTAGSGAATEQRAGIEARHAFRRHIVGSAAIEGLRRDYAGIDVDETEFGVSLGLEYFFNRNAVAFAGWQHTVFRSDFAGSDYEADEVRIGLRLRR